MVEASPVLPPIGTGVHVQGAEGICTAAIVVGGSGEILRLRVFYRAPVTEPVGSRDVEGEYPPGWAPAYAVNPDGTRRVLDSWHWPYHA